MFTILEEKVYLAAIIYNFMDEPSMLRYFTDTFAIYPQSPVGDLCFLFSEKIC